MAEEKNSLKLDGVLSNGYGIIPKKIMRDPDLSIEAKSIYAYLTSYSGSGSTAYPSVSLMCKDLNVSRDRFYRHRKKLIEKDYIRVDQNQDKEGWSNNIYTIVSLPCPQNKDTRNKDTQNKDTQNTDTRNKDTNNNSSNNNSSNNNSTNKDNNNAAGTGNSDSENQEPKPKKQNTKELHTFYQQNFGMENQYIAQEIEYWSEDLNVELVLEAMKRAIEYGGEFGYAKKIMKNWRKNNIDSIEKVEQSDVEFERKNQKKFNKPSKQKVKQDEKLPDWAKKENRDTEQEDKPLDPQRESDLQSRLDRLRKLREEKGAADD